MKDNKIFVHFNTNDINVYKLKDNALTLLKYQQIFFNETLVNEELYNKIDDFLIDLKTTVDEVNNMHVRLYATGIFQEFSKDYSRICEFRIVF